MKNHFVFKFLAILLSALLLMTAVSSGVGIVMLSHYDLYNRTADQGYEEALTTVQQDFAEALIFRFASMELGQCSEALVDEYYEDGPLYSSFRWGRYSYSIRDREGNVLVGVERDLPNATHYEIPVENGRFLNLLSERNADSADPNLGPRDTYEVVIENAVEAAAVEETTAPTVPETTAPPETVPPETEVPAEGEEAGTEEGGEESAEEAGDGEEADQEEEQAAVSDRRMSYASAAEEEEVQETDAPEETEVPAEEGETAPAEDGETAPAETAAPTEAPTVPATEPAETVPEATEETVSPEIDGLVTYLPILNAEGKPYFTRDQYEACFNFNYYDYGLGVMKEATLCFANASDYVVELYLAHDAMNDYQIWDFLKLIGPYRGELVVLLGASLLLFAALLAYLFCAAARKPGTEEVEAGGMNRLPLDLYGALGALGVLGAGWIIAAGYELFKNTVMLQAAAAGFGCFLGCLLIVAFLFACAAQIKTRDGFWWKNTLIFRILGLVLLCLQWVWKGICAQGRKMIPGLQRMGAAVRHWFTLIPVTWQFLIALAAVMLLLCLTIASRKILLVILGVILAVAATVYGGYCFGILLAGVKRMRAGDLKAKVNNQLLVGSFQEFAQELNGLADVAGTAAEKHIKSERMKTELITNVSHDIKTPLTSIINYVDLMEKPHTPEEQEIYMEVLSRQSQRLKKLIDDLIEMSKASTGNLQTEITQVNASEAVMQALGELADKLTAADLEPVFRPSENEIFMMADGRLVWRVLSNLLGNVVKYALPGTRVYVDLQELQEEVLISVKNVSREELNITSEELMERFVRGDVSRNTEGSGLGLNIAKSLMELQGGQLELLVDGDLFKVTLIFPKN